MERKTRWGVHFSSHSFLVAATITAVTTFSCALDASVASAKVVKSRRDVYVEGHDTLEAMGIGLAIMHGMWALAAVFLVTATGESKFARVARVVAV